MDFSKLINQVVGLGAPLLGGALGGPLGSAAGSLLARTLGLSSDASPDSIAQAISVSDPALLKTKMAEAEARWAEAVKAEAETARVVAGEINRTARAEIASSDRAVRLARPATLYTFSGVAGLMGLIDALATFALIAHAIYTGNPTVMVQGLPALAALIGAEVTLLGVLALPATGYVFKRSRDKELAVTGSAPPTLLDGIAAALTGGKA